MTESDDYNQGEPRPDLEEPGLIERTMRALELTKGIEIARRYLAMNAFDGALTMLGLVLGGLIVLTTANAMHTFNTLLLAAVGTSLAMAISGFSGSYLTESAERQREVEDLGKAMLTDMSNSMYAKATRVTSLVVAIVDGLAPSIAAIIVIFPLLLVPSGILEVFTAFIASIVVCMILLFCLGLFLGSISGKNMWSYGAKTLFAGILTALFMFLISFITGAEV